MTYQKLRFVGFVHRMNFLSVRLGRSDWPREAAFRRACLLPTADAAIRPKNE